MYLPLRCRCGELSGRLDVHASAMRAVCYCRDCQAFARFLGQPGRILDAAGGTEVIGTHPRFVHLGLGVQQLACMSLSPKGLYRWYAACCRTPIANTPRNPKLAYAGVLTHCIAVPPTEIERAFGKGAFAVSTASATGQARATPVASARGMLKVAKNLLGARLSGSWRKNPFFRTGTAEPVRVPQVLDPEERKKLRGET